jgi:hypothetical protein
MLLNGYRELFYKGKAKNINSISFPTSAKVKNILSYIFTSCIPLNTAVLKPPRAVTFNLSIEDRAICHFRVQALLWIIVLNKFVEHYLYEIVVVIGRDSL